MKALRINPLALGLALGILWGLSMLIVGIIAHYFLYGTAFVTAMGALYVGYEASIIGSLIGGLIGFVDAFIGGVIIGWLYNVFAGVYKK
jgi:hypothetical protein